MAAVTRRSWIRAAFISVAIAALAGCATSGNPGVASTTSKSGSAWQRPAAPPDPLTFLKAGAAAIAAVPNGTLTFIKSSDENGTYRVLVAAPDGTQQSMDVSQDGATVMVGPTPKNNQSDADKAQTRARVQAARIDYHAAVNKVLVVVPNGSLTELSLGDSNGTTVWQAVAWDYNIVEHKVTINAVSGDVLANKQV